MKVKVKLDQKAILDFLFQHVEKFVFGLFVLLCLLILYSAFANVKRYDKTPADLEAKVAQGKRTLEETQPDVSDLKVVDYVAQAKRSRVAIDEKPYQLTAMLDQPLFPRKSLRGEPPLLPVESLAGAAGNGAFRIAPHEDRPNRKLRDRGEAVDVRTTTGGETQGRRWIVITGIVPLEKQMRAFIDTFKQAEGYNPQDDVPVYLAYWVQRAEINSDEDLTNPKWEKEIFSRQAVEQARNEWAQEAPGDVVASDYLLSSNPDWLTFPLGPLVNRSWDKSVAHEPEIPLATAGEVGPGRRSGMLEGEMMMPLAGRPRSRNSREPMGELMPGRGGRAVVKDDPFGTEKTTEEKTETNLEEKKKNEPARLLFRFFDFDVKPGKRYIYRVSLALQNPNYGVKTAYLKKPELAKEKFLRTKWSEPSPAITVPRDTRVLAKSVKPARATGDPSGEVLLVKWSKSTGYDLFTEMEIVRGQVANKNGVEAKVASGAGRLATINAMKANIRSNAVVLDMRGGETLAGRKDNAIVAPGEILLLDDTGNLIVRNELEDASIREELTTSTTQPARNLELMEGRPDLMPGDRRDNRAPFLLEGIEGPAKRRRPNQPPPLPPGA